MEVLFWAVVFALFVIAEIATVQLVSIWFAVGALATIVFTFVFEDTSILAQLGVFVLASGIFLLITFPWLKKRRNKGHVSTNQELIVGKTATVIEDIDNDKGTGRVTFSGVDWGAVSFDGKSLITAGSVVTIEQVQGTRLVVSLKS